MSYFWDKYERLVRGNVGDMKIWEVRDNYGYAVCFSNNVRTDGKILSEIECIEGFGETGKSPYTNGKIMRKRDGLYLEQK